MFLQGLVGSRRGAVIHRRKNALIVDPSPALPAPPLLGVDERPGMHPDIGGQSFVIGLGVARATISPVRNCPALPDHLAADVEPGGIGAGGNLAAIAVMGFDHATYALADQLRQRIPRISPAERRLAGVRSANLAQLGGIHCRQADALRTNPKRIAVDRNRLAWAELIGLRARYRRAEQENGCAKKEISRTVQRVHRCGRYLTPLGMPTGGRAL